MTDLEMTRLCAEAMGEALPENLEGYPDYWSYYPLCDDAQAMALVKKFWLELFVVGKEQGRQWAVECHDCGDATIEWDLNRAIVECVAKMQAAKK